jgi:hypothetical protein
MKEAQVNRIFPPARLFNAPCRTEHARLGIDKQVGTDRVGGTDTNPLRSAFHNLHPQVVCFRRAL